MNQSIPKVGTAWYHAQTEVDAVVVVSQVEYWLSHFTPSLGRSIRCGGDDCAICKSGWAPQLRVVIGVESVRQGRVLLELRERHRPIFEVLEVGTKIRIWKTGSAKNAPVEVVIAGRKDVEEWSIRNLVASLGTQTILRKSDQSDEVGTNSATA